MIKLFHSKRSRSLRIYWLLEELAIPYELVTIDFQRSAQPFTQATPTGKVPTLQDDDVTMFESGAILEYVLERYGNGRLAPPAGTPQRAAYLQWVHFAEGTAFPPISTIAFHLLVRNDAERLPETMADYRAWAASGLAALERALEGRDYLLGSELSGADIMVGYTVVCAKWFGLLGAEYPRLTAYLARLEARPAFRQALN